jgi:hypothetical protein
VLGLLAEQGLAVLARDLVIIGVDFREGEEAVAVPAIIDERRLQRRLDPGYLGEIDVPLELLVLGGLEIKFLDPVPLTTATRVSSWWRASINMRIVIKSLHALTAPPWKGRRGRSNMDGRAANSGRALDVRVDG